MEFDYPLQITFSSTKSMKRIDVFNMSDEDLIKKYKIEGTFNQWMARQQFKITKDPKGYQSFVLWYLIFGWIDYLFFAMKRFYQQGTFKTICNYSAVGCWLPYNAIYSRWREANS